MMLHAQTGWFWWCYMKHVGCLWSKSSRAASYWNLLNHVRHQSSMWCTRSDSMNCFNRPLLICRRYFWGSCAWMRINSIDMVLLTWSLDAKFGKCAVFPREENPLKQLLAPNKSQSTIPQIIKWLGFKPSPVMVGLWQGESHMNPNVATVEVQTHADAPVVRSPEQIREGEVPSSVWPWWVTLQFEHGWLKIVP